MGAKVKARILGHQRVRFAVQVLVVIFVALLSLGHTREWSWAAGIHTVCPFGGVANLYTYFSTGGFVAKLHDAVFVVLLALLAGLLLTGKSFCGWICPLGSIQEFLGRLGRRFWPANFGRVPDRADRVLRLAKWGVLLLVLVQTARTAKLFFQPYDPYYNLFSIWTDEIAWTGYLVVALTLTGSLFVERPFCRYACPLGAINGLFNSFSMLPLRRSAATCTGCGRCDRVCPAGVTVSSAGTVRSLECTRCLECVEACPANNKGEATLAITPVWRRLRGRAAVPATAFFSVALLAFAAPITLTSLSGDFVTENEHVYETPADIKGSSALVDVIENYPVSQEELYNGFGLPAGLAPATKLKDVQDELGLPDGAEIVVPEHVRMAVASLYRPLSVLVEESVVDGHLMTQLVSGSSGGDGSLPDSTWTLRRVMAEAPPGTAAFLLSGEWPIGDHAASSSDSQAAASSTNEEGEPPSVRGSTTLQELEELVADFPTLLAEFGIPEGEPGTAQLKDLSRRYGFEVSEVREFAGAD